MSGHFCLTVCASAKAAPAWAAAAARCGAARSGRRPSRRVEILAFLSQLRDVGSLRLYWRGAERRPLLHQPAPLLEHVAALIRLLHLAADDMRQGRLDNLVLKPSALARPSLKRCAEAMRSQIGSPHPPQQHQKRHVAQRSAKLASEHIAVGLTGRAQRLHLSNDSERRSG